MKAQQEIFPLFFRQHELVKFEVYENEDQYTVTGHVQCEANGRPGWYYVRDAHSGELHLLLWSELKRIHA